MGIAENIEQIQNTIGEEVKLIAISKTQPDDAIREAYRSGHKIFGENKVQELANKAADLPDDIEWHMVGHLQTNKVKHIAPFVGLIHSVDRLKLLRYINKEARKTDRVIDCLLQFHIAEEESKFGLDLQEAVSLLNSRDYKEMQNIRITGVMGMATFTETHSQIRAEFKQLRQIFNKLKSRFFEDAPYFKEISMGMSHDYKLAIEEGSTMVRIGTAIFGERKPQ